VVHAHRPDGIELAANAGCTQIEHGWLADRGALERMAKSGMYFGNQIALLFDNYAEHGERFDGIGGYTLEGLENLQQSRAGALRVFEEALTVPGLKIVYNSDANAGAHGKNAEEIMAYVSEGGQAPMDTVIAAAITASRIFFIMGIVLKKRAKLINCYAEFQRKLVTAPAFPGLPGVRSEGNGKDFVRS